MIATPTPIVALTVPGVTVEHDTLTAALAYAAGGFYVLPVAAGKHAGSRLGQGWPAKTSRDPRVIASWFAGSNDAVAIHVGRSGAVAFDVDDPDQLPAVMRTHLDAAAVPFHSTRAEVPGRGHYLFRQPAGRLIGNGTGRLGGAWGEVRGRNGIVVVSPSEHPSGGLYRWLSYGEVPMLPADLAHALPDTVTVGDAAGDAEVLAFLDRHRASERPGLLWPVLGRWDQRMREGASRHDTATGCLVWALKEARAGFYPARLAHDELASRFLAAMSRRRRQVERVLSGDMAAAEWVDITGWAVGQAAAADLREVRRLAERAALNRLIGKGATK